MVGKKTRKRSLVPRRDTRYPVDEVGSTLGEVLDLSSSGMRVRVKSKPTLEPGQEETFSVAAHGKSIWVHGRVVWRRRVGLWPPTHEFGVQFLDDRPGLGELMERLAKYGHFPTSEDLSAAEKQRPKPRPASPTTASVIDLYDILGIAPSSSTEEVHAVFRSLAHELHPDHNPSPEAEERFAEVAKAYAVLRDPEQRAQYDRMRGARAKAA